MGLKEKDMKEYFDKSVHISIDPLAYSNHNYLDIVTAMDLLYGAALRDLLGMDDLKYFSVPMDVEFVEWFMGHLVKETSLHGAFEVRHGGQVSPTKGITTQAMNLVPLGSKFSIPYIDGAGVEDHVSIYHVNMEYFVVPAADYIHVLAAFSKLSFPPKELGPDAFKKIHLTSKTEIAKKDVIFFANRGKWFKEHDVPYKRSYLLYGPPGNGKSTFIKLVCEYFGIKPKVFDFSASSNSPDSNFIAWAQGKDPDDYDYDDGPSGGPPSSVSASTEIQILLLEDIDRFFPKGERMTAVSLQAVLNVLDGQHTPENTVIFATANNPEELDQTVLLRPGRFDRRVKFECPEQIDSYRFLRKKFGEEVSDEMLQSMAEKHKGHSYAFFQELYIGSACAAFNRESEVIEDVDVEKVSSEVGEFLSDALTQGTNKKDGGIGFGR